MTMPAQPTAAVDLAALADSLLRDLVLLGVAVTLAMTAVFLVLTIVVYRRVRRLAPVRRSVLAVRAQTLPPGPARSLAQLRRSLDGSVRTTRDCVAHARTRGQRVNELPHSVAHLARTARFLDDQLRDLEHEVDPREQAAQLPVVRERVLQLNATALQVREAVCATATMLTDAELRILAADVDRQALRLASYGAAHRELQEASPGPMLRGSSRVPGR
ncbi:MAG: hypothetical protein ABR541_02840 [Candidatus Dormibacteria bacterium]